MLLVPTFMINDTADDYCLCTVLGANGGDLISFDLSSPSAIRLLSKHWMEREKDCHPLQDFKEDVCTGNIMEVVERELQKYLKERYNYTNNVQLQPTVPITLTLHCCENIIF